MEDKQILLQITSVQRFGSSAPETTRLVTDGSLRRRGGAIELSYAESELTGLSGTTTTFRVEPERIELRRQGAVQSQMIFAVGREDRSLYDLGFGALMLAIRTERIDQKLSEKGGWFEVGYHVVIEEETAGYIRYRIDAKLKK